MFRRSLLLVGVLATLFIAQADTILYTFEGTITESFGISNIPNLVTYNLSIDWNQSASKGLSYPDIFVDNNDKDYGEALFVSGGAFSVNGNEFNPWSKYALRSPAVSEIYIDGNDWGVIYELSAIGSSNGFDFGTTFSYKENHGISSYVKGTATLVAINGVREGGTTSVPEPSTLILLSGSLVGLSCVRLQRKK